MNSLEQLAFALDVVESDRSPTAIVAVAADYIPGANPNNLSPAEMEQRRNAALKSAEARRKTGVTEMMRVRNMAVVDAAVHKAQADYFMNQAAINRKNEIRQQLRDPDLTAAQRQALTDELTDVYETSALYNAERAKEQVQRKQKLRYWQNEMADAARSYDSERWANAKRNVDALKAEMDDEEIAAAMVKEHEDIYKTYIADQERARRAAEKAERERQAQLKKFFTEVERQRKKAEREAEKARKKAEKEAKEGGDDSGMSDYQKSVAAKAEEERLRWYGSADRIPYRQTEAYKNRNKKPKKKK